MSRGAVHRRGRGERREKDEIRETKSANTKLQSAK